jgi:hypothetical protein
VEHFQTELLLDSSREPAARRDLRPLVERIEAWMTPVPPALLPPRLLFLWGSFRFRGFLTSLEELWLRFDPDGTPTRARLQVAMVK